jgi:protein-S-isoprenylcysteine O-methyltransferase
MDIKLIIIFTFSVLYGFFEIYMSRRNRGARKVTLSGDKKSLVLLTLSIGLGYWLSFIMASSRTGRIFHWNTMFITGMILAGTGLIIRVSSILKLKNQFTYTVTKIDNHRLIETGLYKRIRHPGYLGQLIIFLGISTSLSNWISILLMMIPVTCGFMYRIIIEEKFMEEQMGKVYSDYKRRTYRLIPWII